MSHRIHLAVALERAGWHPAAGRAAGVRPRDLVTPKPWADQIRALDRAGVVFATIEDALALTDRFEDPDDPTPGRVRGRLDAVLLASALAPLTHRIGLIPTVTTTHTEPFHVATGIQTVDFASRGRAGVRLVVGGSAAERANFGRRDELDADAGFREAGEVADALGRLWDSWQDDAIIRDAATGRFVDADRIHNVDVAGEFFSITGASIVPRSPQGRPIVAVLAHESTPYRLAAEHADVVFVTPHGPAAATGILAELDGAAAELRRSAERLRVFADLVVLIDDVPGRARDALARLDELDGGAFRSDAAVVAGTPTEVADHIRARAETGVDGVRLRPARQPDDVVAIADRLAPLLRATRVLRDDDAATLRGRLGLPRPPSRYAGSPARDHRPASAREKVAP
ncbi:LLM class flavin-dependent oxidoreductase [Microbacterium sp. NM3R9]|uniref:LLM class flavin-dependent oxidoreductase n=1 Tax=Microbacterium thalli TaxID=3027921 RepID=UPI002366A087|nr:LLM class flavin-dependent oxidoreductase [Microbacterium thalli]MDN8549793.1 LLM class flavin-dependent oxidoreductase [Microbacterium thalli]